MTSPLEAYLKDNPDLREKNRAELVEELYQTSGVKDYAEFTQKLITDPDDPSGAAKRLRTGIKPDEKPAPEEKPPDPNKWKPGDTSFLKGMYESGKNAFTLPGEQWQHGMKGERLSREGLADRAGEMAGWVSPMAPSRAPFMKAPAEAWRAPPDDPILSRVVPHPERPTGELTNSFDRVYSKIKDEYHAIGKAEKSVTGHWPGSPTNPLSARESPYKLMRLMKGNPGRMEHWIENGTVDFTTGEVVGPSLRAVMDPVKNNLQDAMRYAISKRALEKGGQNIETGIDQGFAKQVVDGIEKAAKEGDLAASSIVKFQKDLVGYNDALLKYLVDAGVVSKDGYKAIREANMDYLPFYRLLNPELAGGAPGKGARNPVKEMIGSDKEILDPIESVIRNTYSFIHIAERNRVAKALWLLVTQTGEKGAQLGEELPYKARAIELGDQEVVNFLKQYDVLTEQPAAFTIFRPSDFQPRPNEIVVMFDGQKKLLRVDPEIGTAWSKLDELSANALAKYAAYPAGWLRAGVTLDPGFTIRNLFRDQFAPLATMPGSYIPFYDAAMGMRSIFKNGDSYTEWLRSGGANSTRVAIDQAYLNVARQKLLGSAVETVGTKLNPFEAARYLSNFMENATRVGAYRRLRMQGYDAMDAAYISRESTLDFARVGQSMRALNMITAFQNAQMEGVDRIGRAIATRPAAATTALVGGITAPSLMLWYANHDDPRYQQMERWRKDVYWPIFLNDWQDVTEQDTKTLKASLPLRQLPSGKWQANYGKPILLPKPFEMGVIFGSVPERMLEAYYKDNPAAYKNLATSVERAFLPELLPTVLKPWLETQANWSYFFDRPIESASMQRLLPKYRYTEFTSETAKLLAKGIDSLPGVDEVSPVAVDYWIRNWTGTLGTYALDLADTALRKSGAVSEKVKPTWAASDYPIIRSFTTRNPTVSAQSIQDFYENFRKQEQRKNTATQLMRRPDEKEEGESLQAGKAIVAVQSHYTALNTLRQLIYDVMRNQDIEAADKRKLIDTYTFQMIAIAKEGGDLLRAGVETPKKTRTPSIPHSEDDERLNTFGRMQSNDSQALLLKQMPLPEQMKYAPYAHAKLKKEMTNWFMSMGAEEQSWLMEIVAPDDRTFWVPYAKPEVKKKYDDLFTDDKKPAPGRKGAPGLITPRDFFNTPPPNAPVPPPPKGYDFKPSWGN